MIMVIYPHLLFGVVLMVILHVLIIKNYPKLFSNYYPKFIFWVTYPFYDLREVIHKFNLPEHYPIVQEEMAVFSSF